MAVCLISDLSSVDRRPRCTTRYCRRLPPRQPPVLTQGQVSFFNREDDAANEKLGHIVLDVVQPGVHSICFNNVMSRWTAKVVRYSCGGVARTLPPIVFSVL